MKLRCATFAFNHGYSKSMENSKTKPYSCIEIYQFGFGSLKKLTIKRWLSARVQSWLERWQMLWTFDAVTYEARRNIKPHNGERKTFNRQDKTETFGGYNRPYWRYAFYGPRLWGFLCIHPSISLQANFQSNFPYGFLINPVCNSGFCFWHFMPGRPSIHLGS